MNNFKRCATAVALVMTAAVPAFAQELPEQVVVAVEGTNTGYRVPVTLAAELCGDVPAETLAALATDADVIYCTVAETVVVERGFETTPEIELLSDLNTDDEDGDGMDDDGDGNDSDDDETDNDLLDGDNDGEGTDDDSADGEDMDDSSDDESSDDDASDDGASGDDASEDDASGDDASGDDASEDDDEMEEDSLLEDTDPEADADSDANTDG